MQENPDGEAGIAATWHDDSSAYSHQMQYSDAYEQHETYSDEQPPKSAADASFLQHSAVSFLLSGRASTPVSTEAAGQLAQHPEPVYETSQEADVAYMTELPEQVRTQLLSSQDMRCARLLR